jgi:hypothetical protein
LHSENNLQLKTVEKEVRYLLSTGNTEMIYLKEFFRTGGFGKVTIGARQLAVLDELGVPDRWINHDGRINIDNKGAWLLQVA